MIGCLAWECKYITSVSPFVEHDSILTAKEKTMAFTLPSLPYATNALEPYIDATTMEIHQGRHHKAYVDNLNKALEGQAALASKPIEQLLREIATVPDGIRQAVINNGGGHANHAMFWEIMAPGAGGEPSGPLADDIKATFTDFATFKAQIKDAGVKRFGSGWAWLVTNHGKLDIVSTANQDNPLMGKSVAGCEGTPVIGCDVWEHAYYLKYQNKRADYLKAFWNVVNWNAVHY